MNPKTIPHKGQKLMDIHCQEQIDILKAFDIHDKQGVILSP